jgi:hypothetical protein
MKEIMNRFELAMENNCDYWGAIEDFKCMMWKCGKVSVEKHKAHLY